MKKTLMLILSQALLLLAVSCSGNKASSKASDMPVSEYVGIDVSRHQKEIDWEKVAGDKSVTFVYIKATEGATLVDPYYKTNMKGARRQGIKVGAYHYFSTKSSVDAQASNFLKQLKTFKQDLIPMIDVESRGSWSRNEFIDSVAKLANIIEKRYKRKPMIYSMMEFYNDNLAPHFNSYPLYIGRYSTAKPKIKWNGKYTIWQYSEDGIVTGIYQKVDLNRFNKGVTLDDITL